MTMKLICGCLLAVTLLGCLADAQYSKPQPKPEVMKYTPQKQDQQSVVPPKRYTPVQTQQTQQSQQSQQPQNKQTKQPNTPTETFHSCEVAEHLKIQCGAPGTGASDCESINCCFDGRMCYYGKHVTLQCTKDAQFIVVVARDATLPNIDLETISFIGTETCSPVGVTSAFAIYQFPATGCGTIMMEEPGVIIYENRMTSSFEIAVGERGIITRDSRFELIVQCRYIGVTVEALVIEVGLVPPPPPVAAPGPLRVQLQIANGQCFTKGCVEEDVVYSSYYVNSDYPVTKVLREPVYVDIEMLERTDPNLVLTLGRCWATSDPYPHSLPQWDLLIDGCPYRDDRYLTSVIPMTAASGLQFPTHHSRFMFKMFTFVGDAPADGGKGGVSDARVMIPLKVKVYIHCDVAVCQPSLGNNCLPRCFRKKRDILASVQSDARSETTVVSSNELIFEAPSQSVQ